MGMFDTIICNYDVGPGFWNKELQTKDLICLMTEFWLSPSGNLYEIDYSGTYDWVNAPKVNHKSLRDSLLIPKANGNHGKVKPKLITKSIEVYPAKWDVKYAPFPTCHLTFVDGILKHVERPIS